MTSPAVELRNYRVYGLRLRTSLPLTFAADSSEQPGDPDVEVLDDAQGRLPRAFADSGLADDPESWMRHARLPDGSTYVRWEELFHFLISSDGRHVVYGPLSDPSQESTQTYLLGQVLSYALTKQGHEPLHATVVVSDGHAIGFLGESGMGKSTLAAAFLRTGATMLTDDMLRLEPQGDGFVGFPGPPRIKLLPHIAERLAADHWSGSLMHPWGPKQVFPLPEQNVSPEPVPIAALYALAEPDAESAPDSIVIRPLSGRDAVIELVAHTFNRRILDHARLVRQFKAAQAVAAAVPVRVLAYPRNIDQVFQVCAAVRQDLASLTP